MANFFKKQMALRLFLWTVLAICSINFSAFAQTFDRNQSPLPAPTGMVNDYANVIDDGTERQIEQKLRDFKKTTNPPVEIAVVTIKTTGGRDIFEYSMAVARGWKIGSDQTDNPGALLLVAVDDRKYFTQISKDLEGDLSDGISGSLQRQFLVPAFKQGQYGKGISDTIDAYITRINQQRANPDAKTQAETSGKTSKGTTGGSVICCLVVFILIVIILIMFGSRGGGNGSGGTRDRWRSGGFGGSTSNNSSWIAPVIVGSSWGSGSSSSSSSWGGGSSGGDSWGGFGGGGDFGGGGSGGDW